MFKKIASALNTIANKVDSIDTTPVNKVTTTIKTTIKDEVSSFSSTYNYLQAKRTSKKIARNPEFALLLNDEMNRS